MLIERLRLVVEEGEAAAWAARLLEGTEELKAPRVGFEPGALIFEGRLRVPLAGDVPFRTAWAVEMGAEGRVAVRLTQASAFGWSGGSGFLTGLIMGKVRERLGRRPGCAVEGDCVLFDPALLLAGLPVDVRIRVASVSLEAGRFVLEAG